MDQTLINWIMGGFGALIGFMLKGLADAMKDLHAADQMLAEKVSAVEVLVAGDYVRRSIFDKTVERLFQKLDTIELKINGKVDR